MKCKFVHALLAFSLMSLAGCSIVDPDALHDSGDLSIRTNQDTYRVSENLLEIQATIRNRLGAPVYLSESLGTPVFILEKLVNGEWTMAYRPIITADLKPPTKLDDGESLSREFTIQHIQRERNRSPFWEIKEPLSGTYRIVIAARRTPGDVDNLYRGDPLPQTNRMSNTFEITE